MENIFLLIFLYFIAGILFKNFLLSVDISFLLVLFSFLLGLVFSRAVSVLFLLLSFFLLGYYVAKPKDIKNITNNPLFIECKVSSFPQVYFDKYKFNCIVLKSENDDLLKREITVISDYKPVIFSNIYSIGNIKLKYDKLWFYAKTPFLKEDKNQFIQNVIKIRDYLINSFKDKTLNQQTFALGNALIFGDRSYLDKETKDAFINTGLIHLLAISGLHIALIIGILIFILSFFSRKLSYIFTMIFLFFYPIIAAFHIPVVRASFMGILYLYSKLKYLSLNPLNLLFFVAFVFVFFNPETIFSLSFQLSFLAVLGLILSKDLFLFSTGNKVLNFLFQSLLVSFIATLWTAPLIIYTFHKFSITSVFATTVIILILTFYLFFAILNLLTLFFLTPVINIMDYTGLLIIKLTKFFDSFGLQAVNLDITFIEVVIFYLFLTFFSIYIKDKRYKIFYLFTLFIFLLFISKF
jgi:competence protein ComEC